MYTLNPKVVATEKVTSSIAMMINETNRSLKQDDASTERQLKHAEEQTRDLKLDLEQLKPQLQSSMSHWEKQNQFISPKSDNKVATHFALWFVAIGEMVLGYSVAQAMNLGVILTAMLAIPIGLMLIFGAKVCAHQWVVATQPELLDFVSEDSDTLEEKVDEKA